MFILFLLLVYYFCSEAIEALLSSLVEFVKHSEGFVGVIGLLVDGKLVMWR